MAIEPRQPQNGCPALPLRGWGAESLAAAVQQRERQEVLAHAAAAPPRPRDAHGRSEIARGRPTSERAAAEARGGEEPRRPGATGLAPRAWRHGAAAAEPQREGERETPREKTRAERRQAGRSRRSPVRPDGSRTLPRSQATTTMASDDSDDDRRKSKKSDDMSRSKSRSRSRSRSGSRSKSRSKSRSRSRSKSPAKGSNERVTRVIDVDKDDAAFVLGRGGSTKRKIARVSGPFAARISL